MSKAQGIPQPIDMAIYNDRTSLALPGWDNLRPQVDMLWSLTTCKKYITMSHLLRMWPNVETKLTWNDRWEFPLDKCRDDIIAARYIEVYDALHDKKWEDLARTPMMTYSNTAMVYAEVVLKKRVDWSTATARNKRTLQKTRDIPSLIPALQRPQGFEDGARGLSPVHNLIPDATDDLNALLDAEATAPANCEPAAPTTSAGQSGIRMDEDFPQMQRMLDASYNENEELRRRVQELEHERFTSHQSVEMAKIAELLEVSQRNLNEAVERLNALQGSITNGKQPL